MSVLIKKSLRYFFYSLLIIITGVVVNRSFYRIYYVPSPSMAPTLLKGDIIFAKVIREPIKNKDVYIIAHPTKKEIIVKRIAALAGEKIDTVFYRARRPIGSVVVPGSGDSLVLDKNKLDLYLPVIKREMYIGVPFEEDSVIVKKYTGKNFNFRDNYCFVLGDNHNQSDDSRFFGFVPEENLLCKAEYIIFSYNKGFRWDRALKKIK